MATRYPNEYYHQYDFEITMPPGVGDERIHYLAEQLFLLQDRVLRLVYFSIRQNAAVFSFSIGLEDAAVTPISNTPWGRFHSPNELYGMLERYFQSKAELLDLAVITVRVEMVNPTPRRNTRTRPGHGGEIRYPVAGYGECNSSSQIIHYHKNKNYTELPARRRFGENTPPPLKLKRSAYIKNRVAPLNRAALNKTEKDSLSTREVESTQCGSYELLNPQEKFLYKKSIELRYLKDKVVLMNPETNTLNCFLMAVIRSECIYYAMDPTTGTILSITKEGGDSVAYQPDLEEQWTENVSYEFWNELEEDYSFVYTDEQGNIRLRLFNTYFTEEIGVREKYFWELAAYEIEDWLQQEQNFQGKGFVNVNDLESIGQSTSNLFEICITIYDVEHQGEKVWVFIPNNRNIQEEIQVNNGFRMIHLLYDHGHMYPILNIRKYLKPNLVHYISLYGFCPVCGICNTKEMLVIETAKQHMAKCIAKIKYQEGFPCKTKGDFIQQSLEENYSPVYEIFDKELRYKVKKCTYCHTVVQYSSDLFHHNCKILSKTKEQLSKRYDNNRLFVYDLEAAQEPVPYTTNTYYHVCNCVCMKGMYDDSDFVFQFANEMEFIEFLCTDERMRDSVLLAHNGGSYDGHFMVRILERLNIGHSFTPSPNSMHKYLSIHIEEPNITFLDFIYFMPGSLKNIAISMGLEVQKGDFPHKFNTKANENYVGPVPIINHPKDYWCLQTKKTVADKKEVEDFVKELEEKFCDCHPSTTLPCLVLKKCYHCNKPLWEMKKELFYYCCLDVKVLALACRKYRDELLELDKDNSEEDTDWNACAIDPYFYMTVPQLALQIELGGFEVPRFYNALNRYRRGQRIEAISWLEGIMKEEGSVIYHRNNWIREYYDLEIEKYADGYNPITRQIYVCLDCNWYPCEKCCQVEIHHAHHLDHPNYPGWNYAETFELTLAIENLWLSRNAIVIHSCQIPLHQETPYTQECMKGSRMEEYFKGGRTEVFKPYVNQTLLPNKEIYYHDVCSLYPYVCAFCTLPFGLPIYIPGYQVNAERLFHTDETIKYWGYIRCKVIPNPTCKLGLLPLRDENQRLLFPVYEMIGCWGLDEMELAYKNGYKIVEIYEIIHWSKENRTNTYFRGYVEFFLRMKQEAEGWKKLGKIENPTEAQKIEIQQQVYKENGNIALIRIDRVKKNPIKRQLAKLFLNSLWGKFAQKTKTKAHCTLYSFHQFHQLWYDKRIQKETCLFREIGQNIYKVEYEMNENYVKSNPRGNIYLAAKVTEHARCILHSQCLKIGPENVIYTDTDSVIFIRDKDAEVLTGTGLGKWTDEYEGKKILKFYALAPKCYFLSVEGEDQLQMKAKGIQLTNRNREYFYENKLQEILEHKGGEKPFIQVDYMTIYANCQQNLGVQYGVLLSRYGEKKVQLVISKRKLVTLDNYDWKNLAQLDSFPLGYTF